MMDMVIDALMLLGVATVAVFLILMAVDVALFLKLRSSIPQQPIADSES
jgi:hypothetical protein